MGNKIENIQLKPVKKRTEVTHDSKIEKEEKEAHKTKKDTFTKDENGSVPTTVQTEEPETNMVEKNHKTKNDMKNKKSDIKPKSAPIKAQAEEPKTKIIEKNDKTKNDKKSSTSDRTPTKELQDSKPDEKKTTKAPASKNLEETVEQIKKVNNENILQEDQTSTKEFANIQKKGNNIDLSRKENLVQQAEKDKDKISMSTLDKESKKGENALTNNEVQSEICEETSSEPVINEKKEEAQKSSESNESVFGNKANQKKNEVTSDINKASNDKKKEQKNIQNKTLERNMDDKEKAHDKRYGEVKEKHKNEEKKNEEKEKIKVEVQNNQNKPATKYSKDEVEHNKDSKNEVKAKIKKLPVGIEVQENEDMSIKKSPNNKDEEKSKHFGKNVEPCKQLSHSISREDEKMQIKQK